jgi:pyruvate dehydrogenase E2 component (dihydrolipoamide acetyltransferase)
MPKLSPTMRSGKIEKWFVRKNCFVTSYQLLLEISTQSLTQEYENHIMEIEIIDEVYLAKLFAEAGSTLQVGKPIAVFCNNAEDIETVCDAKVILILLNILSLIF